MQLHISDTGIVSYLQQVTKGLFLSSGVATESVSISLYALYTLLRCPSFKLILRSISILRNKYTF